MRSSRLVVGLVLALAAGCVPTRTLPLQDIPKLTSLEEVMHVQATYADPQFSKIGSASFTDADWAELTDLSQRIQATSTKMKDFSKGAGFDAFATRLDAKATELGTASAAKDVASANKALEEMKGTCKACHGQFK